MNTAFKGWRRYFLVEPPVFLYFFGQAISGIFTTELLYIRSFQAMNATTNVTFAENTQYQVSYILMYKSFIDGLIPAILTFFLGPWSDRYGRKSILIASYVGSAISFLLWSILSSMDLNPWFYLIASVPPALVGGYNSLILATYCYITDITTDQDRAWHLTWQQSVIPVGQFLGYLIAPSIFRKFNFVGIFGTTSTCAVIAMLYVIIFVPETVIPSNERNCACSLFDLSLIKSMIATCIKKREETNRIIIWCCILSLSLIMLIGEGELNIVYLFVKATLDWNVTRFAMYQVIVVFLTAIGVLLGAKLIRSCWDKSMTNMSIAIFALTSSLIGALIRSLTTEYWHFYLSTGIGMFSGLLGPFLRAVLSKSVPVRDSGKVFSLATSMEAVIPLAAVPLYTMIYAHYMPPIYPSPVYLLSVGFYVLIFILILTIHWRIKTNVGEKIGDVIEKSQNATIDQEID